MDLCLYENLESFVKYRIWCASSLDFPNITNHIGCHWFVYIILTSFKRNSLSCPNSLFLTNIIKSDMGSKKKRMLYTPFKMICHTQIQFTCCSLCYFSVYIGAPHTSDASSTWITKSLSSLNVHFDKMALCIRPGSQTQ